MNFIFQGFQSSLPLWLFFVLFVGALLLSWWSYQHVKGIDNFTLYGLILLRSSAFAILLMVLLNPLFEATDSYYHPPATLVLLDNSVSTSLEKSIYSGIEDYKNVLAELDFQDTSVTSFTFRGFGNELSSMAPEELTFDADQTNLAEPIQAVRQRKDNISAAILISDGIYTRGQNPIYEAQDLSIPVFTLGLGDTTVSRDVLVSSVSTNPTGYLNTRHSVTAIVNTNGFNGEQFPIHLQEGEEIISTEIITPADQQSTEEVTFDLMLEQEGLQQYELNVPGQPDEWTTANNTQLFSVNVRDARQRILSLAFEIHPDVRFLRSLLMQDENISLTSRTWTGGEGFLEGDLSVKPDTLDLAIIHGFPGDRLSANLAETIKNLAEEVPLLVVATPLFDFRTFEQKIHGLPVMSTASLNFNSVALTPDQQQANHPILDLPPVNFEQLQRLWAPKGNLEPTPGARQLFSSTFQGVSTNSPILAVQEVGNKRVAVSTAYGWFRLNQSTNPQVREFIQQLWLNTVSWTVTDPEDQKLQVQPVKNTFSESESVTINAALTNERGQPESKASIDVSISSDSSETFYAMESQGSGKYQIKLNRLPEGVYSFTATAKKETRIIDTQQGEFTVARSNAEYLQTRRNDQLLRQIANRTGGFYLPYDSAFVFWDRIQQQDLLEPVLELETTYFHFNRHFSWFLLVIVCLSAEWIIRKLNSLP